MSYRNGCDPWQWADIMLNLSPQSSDALAIRARRLVSRWRWMGDTEPLMNR
jgi:hypothetical protein